MTSGVQERSAGIELLTEKMKKESLPLGEEITDITLQKMLQRIIVFDQTL